MKKYGIFGNPVAHSKSPNMHNRAFKACHIDACYDKYLVENADDLKKIFFEQNLQGVNITVPHKEQAYKQADEVRGIAREIGAVNTWVKEGDKIIAYNTDAPGFFKAIESFGEIKTALLIGAGGTAKAIALMLKQEGIEVVVLNRSENRLSDFREKGFVAYTWESYIDAKYDLVINSTSAGLKEDNLPAPKELMEKIIRNSKNAIDCVYGKKTPFLELANMQNIPFKDGEDMLLYQGVLAYGLFTNNICDERNSEKVMHKGLTENMLT